MKKTNGSAIWLAVGVGVGTAIALVTHRVWLGVGVGTVLAILVLMLEQRFRR